MIVIKVFKHHATEPGKVTKLGELKIWNTGKGTKTRGKYRAELYGKNGKFMNTTYIENWPRLALHTWDLILACLKRMRKDVG